MLPRVSPLSTFKTGLGLTPSADGATGLAPACRPLLVRAGTTVFGGDAFAFGARLRAGKELVFAVFLGGLTAERKGGAGTGTTGERVACTGRSVVLAGIVRIFAVRNPVGFASGGVGLPMADFTRDRAGAGFAAGTFKTGLGLTTGAARATGLSPASGRLLVRAGTTGFGGGALAFGPRAGADLMVGVFADSLLVRTGAGVGKPLDAEVGRAPLAAGRADLEVSGFFFIESRYGRAGRRHVFGPNCKAHGPGAQPVIRLITLFPTFPSSRKYQHSSRPVCARDFFLAASTRALAAKSRCPLVSMTRAGEAQIGQISSPGAAGREQGFGRLPARAALTLSASLPTINASWKGWLKARAVPACFFARNEVQFEYQYGKPKQKGASACG